MLVEVTSLSGLLIFTPTVHVDERGYVTRTCDAAIAESVGVDPWSFVQDGQSRSHQGVIRGLHLRRGQGEAALVRCSFGEVFDVVVDLRPGSKTFGRHETFRLNDQQHRTLYIPRGCAHGYQALTEPADVFFRVDSVQDASEVMAIAHDDPAIGISWPFPPTLMSERDSHAPRLDHIRHLLA